MIGDFTLSAIDLPYTATLCDAARCGFGGADRSPADLRGDGVHAGGLCDLDGGKLNAACDPHPEPAGDRGT